MTSPTRRTQQHECPLLSPQETATELGLTHLGISAGGHTYYTQLYSLTHVYHPTFTPQGRLLGFRKTLPL